MVKSFLIQRVLRQYQNKLPKALKTNYGGSGRSEYTEGQVRSTIKELKLSSKHMDYAILMFCGGQALQNESSESLLQMTKLIGTLGSGGVGAGDSYGPAYDSSAGSFDGGGADGGGGD